MSDPTSANPPAAPRRRGRPPRDISPLPPPRWVTAEAAAARLCISVATLWRGVDDGRITPPSYPSEKTPRFNLDVLDADMERARAKPSECEAGRRAARLTEARQRARETARERTWLNAAEAGEAAAE
jgi:hypothetical protein